MERSLVKGKTRFELTKTQGKQNWKEKKTPIESVMLQILVSEIS